MEERGKKLLKSLADHYLPAARMTIRGMMEISDWENCFAKIKDEINLIKIQFLETSLANDLPMGVEPENMLEEFIAKIQSLTRGIAEGEAADDILSQEEPADPSPLLSSDEKVLPFSWDTTTPFAGYF